MDSYEKAVSAFESCRRESTDINEHLPVLRTLARICGNTVELGVRNGQSTNAFVLGCLEHEDACTLTGRDLLAAPAVYKSWCSQSSPRLKVTFEQGNDLLLPPHECDLLFIDTFHVYGQLKRELDHYSKTTHHVIVLHDTEVDSTKGELIRNGWDAAYWSKLTGIPCEELIVGLWPAVEEFLTNNPDWILLRRYRNNNGLTILVRANSSKLEQLRKELSVGSTSCVP